MKPMRAAIVGLGSISFEHVTKLERLPNVEIAGLCDVHSTLAAAVSERFGGRPHFADFEEMMVHVKPHVVHVLTPPQSHRELVLRALDGGAHVVVEKPIGAHWADYVEMRDAAARKELLLVENYNWRCLNVVRRALEMTGAGGLGRVVNVRVSFGGVMGPEDPSSDRNVKHFSHDLPGGPLYNFATHPISVAASFMDQCSVVSAVRRRLDPTSSADDELVVLVGGSTTCGVVAVTKHVQPGRFTLDVECDQGSLEVDLYNQRLYADAAGSGMVKIVNGLRHGLSYMTGTGALVARTALGRQDFYEGLGWLLRRFYDAVATGAPPPISTMEMDRVNGVMRSVFEPGPQP